MFDGLKNGQPTYKDLNGDGNITEADRTIIGSAQPNYTGGWTVNAGGLTPTTLGALGQSVTSRGRRRYSAALTASTSRRST